LTVKAPKKAGRRSSLKNQREAQLPMMRNSERGAFKKCRFVWSLGFENFLQPKTAAPALRFGTLVHKALAAWYIPGLKRGVPPADTFTKLYEEELKEQESFGFRDEDGKWHKAAELGVAMMENYIEQYGTDDRWEVLATEQPFWVVVNHPVTGKPWFRYAGVVDGIWRWRPDKKIWIPDHKTSTGLSESMVKYLKMDDQAGGYWTFGVDWLYANKFLGPRQKLAGMVFNFMNKKMPDERPFKIVSGKRLYLNKDSSVSKVQPAMEFLRQKIYRDEADRLAQRQRAIWDYGEIEMVHNGELQITKNPTKMNCGTCWAIDICELHESGHDWEEFMKATTRHWDPYAEHEIYEGEAR